MVVTYSFNRFRFWDLNLIPRNGLNGNSAARWFSSFFRPIFLTIFDASKVQPIAHLNGGSHDMLPKTENLKSVNRIHITKFSPRQGRSPFKFPFVL